MYTGLYESHDSEFMEGVAGAHSVFDRLSDQFFSAGFFDGEDEDLFHRLPRRDAHAFAVAEDQVARLDAYAVNFNREAEINHFAARPLVLGVTSPGESRKSQLQDASGIARIAVYHRPRRAQLHRARTHQLAPQRVPQ